MPNLFKNQNPSYKIDLKFLHLIQNIPPESKNSMKRPDISERRHIFSKAECQEMTKNVFFDLNFPTTIIMFKKCTKSSMAHIKRTKLLEEWNP